MDAITQIKDWINLVSRPEIFLGAATLLFVLILVFYKQLTHPAAAIVVLLASVGGYAASMLDKNFRAIVGKPDNVPITMLLFMTGFFLWLALRQAAVNDTRMERGEPLLEGKPDDKVLVWPDLVYIEFMIACVCTIVLIVWAIAFAAPLEEPANPSIIPNPSKAPWYFLGLQEMLVYFDPWLAGVVYPSLIILGLCAIPYIDVNPKGNGYYTLKERRFAIFTWLFGFLILWVVLIVIGTFFRGPNWNFFGPYEAWDPNKAVAMVNVNLSELFWAIWLHKPMPDNPLLRELPGIVVFLGYLMLIPPLALVVRPVRRLYEKMGFIRYSLMMVLALFMALMVIKPVLRWTVDLKYIISFPEYFFNI
ncbi:MAG: hypothetical protein BIFFINMI_04008 [Phycisphaerae bacterium]|nr:hypothetical protein [Phycisphaerae bacterium]